jgi:outer membrane biosynthesis protein TonB
MATDGKKKRTRRPSTPTIVVGIGVLLLIAIGFGIARLMEGADLPAKRKEVTIQLVQPPPPPPPPPPPKPPDEPPPPEDKIEEPEPEPEPEPEQQPEPEPQAEEAPPVVSEGPGGSDSFGLRGGKNVAGKPGVIGGGGDNKRYGMNVARALQALVSAKPDAKSANYQIKVHVWVTSDGRLERYELLGSSGNPKVDAAVRAALSGSPDLGGPPPPGISQPLRLLIASRSGGSS